MNFAKYQGLGNDFVLLADPNDEVSLDPDLVRNVCDRRFGIGGDGVIRVGRATDGGELFMDYVNSDGSVGEMCGNGIRCLALFARDRGFTSGDEIKVDTRAGLKVVTILESDLVRVDMGEPLFAAADIPVNAVDPLHLPLRLGDVEQTFLCLSMGNPHAVTFVDDPGSIDLVTVGPAIENDPIFPNKTNIEFARVDSSDHVTMVVWERGSGATLACGTGACAVAVAARLLQGANEAMTISLPGGDLEVSWAGDLDTPAPVMMTGPAVCSFTGEIDLEAYR